MDQVQDHVVYCPEGFYDMNRYPERVEQGGTRTVTQNQFRQMHNSDPTVELKRIQPPQDILKRIVESAREEKAAQVADPEVEWKPVGWYAAQLAKGEKDD